MRPVSELMSSLLSLGPGSRALLFFRKKDWVGQAKAFLPDGLQASIVCEEPGDGLLLGRPEGFFASDRSFHFVWLVGFDFSPHEAEAVLKRVYEGLKPNGRILIHESSEGRGIGFWHPLMKETGFETPIHRELPREVFGIGNEYLSVRRG